VRLPNFVLSWAILSGTAARAKCAWTYRFENRFAVIAFAMRTPATGASITHAGEQER